MKMPLNSTSSLPAAVSAAGDPAGRFVFAAAQAIPWTDLLRGSVLDSRGDELRGRSVLIATKDQLTTLWALMELDGNAKRLILYPADLPLEHLPYVIEAAGVDVLVTDRLSVGDFVPKVRYFAPCHGKVTPLKYERAAWTETEWILLTSGTTGPPKLALHTFASLCGAITISVASLSPNVWSTFYDIRRYGGLQILLRAALGGSSLVLHGTHESAKDFLTRAAMHGVTHISGTPTHWRQALMTSSAHLIAPEYIRLSGEIADQGVLNHLQSCYPEARVSHAFASTEAGVAFEVSDGLTGFPASTLTTTSGVDMKVERSSLRIRSNRTASRYLGQQPPALRDIDGFVDTCDLLELRNGRYHFVGRRDGVINVGGLKVHPEEVEAIINRHPDVQMSLVRAKNSPIVGSLVVADVVLSRLPRANGGSVAKLQQELTFLCRNALSPHKVPALINVVEDLAVAESGKLVRTHA